MLQTAGLPREGTELSHVAHGHSEGAAARWEDGQNVGNPQSAAFEEDLLSGGSPSEGSAAGDLTAARHHAQASWQPLHPVGECAAEAGVLPRALHQVQGSEGLLHTAGDHSEETEVPPGPQHSTQAFQHPLRPALERATRAQAQHQARSGMEPPRSAAGEALLEAQHPVHTSEGLMPAAAESCGEARALSRVQQGTETSPTDPAVRVGASNAAAVEAVPVPPTSAPARGRLATAVGAAARQQRKPAPAQQAGALPKQQVPDVPPQAGRFCHGVAYQRSSAPSGAGQAAAAAAAVQQQEAGPQGCSGQAQQDPTSQHAWNRAFPQPAPSEGLTAAIAALEAGDNGTLGAILNPTGKLQLLCSQGPCHCPVLVAEPCTGWQSSYCYAWHLLASHTFRCPFEPGESYKLLSCWLSEPDMLAKLWVGFHHPRTCLQGGCTPPSQPHGVSQQAASTPSSQTQLPVSSEPYSHAIK